MPKYRVQTLNAISPLGLQAFDAERYDVGNTVEKPHALLVRSFDLHTWSLPASVEVIGRAGVGVNTIPVPQLSLQGIPVLNTPGANANAVKELVLAGMLMASRHLNRAWHYTNQFTETDQVTLEQIVESTKKQFAGTELCGKTLGVIGLGSIGVKIANAAVHLDMRVIGYDPAMTVRNAWELSPLVQQAHALIEVLTQADFVTVHVPLNDKTHHLFNERSMRSMKNGAILLNFARDHIVETEALLQALEDKKLRCYVCDFPNIALYQNPNVIALPHIGASTQEAEENCAVMVAQNVRDFLEQGHIRCSVNFPDVELARTDGYRLAITNANVPNMVAQISTVLSEANLNIIDMINKSRGDLAYTLLDVDQPVTDVVFQKMAAIEGVIRVRRVG
ncbi:MAG: 3-phosphoglycerate dehydrogenase [Gammaproteobacteria bacterium RIFCSPHIGHO2_12_FULL_45_9]|nr:MAG: 3-phosphoglycerate dehydrogenase [Gammaproteobacteria bacterium RIFCSPHIGHO2_12_FULL_45_9]